MKQHSANEPIATYGQNTYADVMAYLHSIRLSPEVMESLGHQLIFEAKNEHIGTALRRLEQISALEYDWDGYGAPQINKTVLDNLKKVINASEDKDWVEWVISPETQGTLCITSKNQTASISLGINEFSYYSFSMFGEKAESHVPFTPTAFLNTMKKLI